MWNVSVQYVCQLVFGVLGSILILSNNEPKATVWVLDTCLIVGLLPLIIILLTASLSSKTFHIAPSRDHLAFDERDQHCSDPDWRALLDLVFHVDFGGLRQFPLRLLIFGFVDLVWWGMKYCNHLVQRSSAGIPSMRRPASRELTSASVELCETEICFLHIQLIVGVLKQSKSALLCCVSHMAILSVFTCVMNVRDQTRQTFVTSFSPFRYRTSKFVHRPRNIKSPNTSQIQTFQNNLWANCRSFNNWSIFFFFKLNDRASLFTDQRILGLPTCAKYRHFRTICEQTVDNSPTGSFSESVNWWSSMHGVATLYNCCVVLFASSQYLSIHFFAWPSMS